MKQYTNTFTLKEPKKHSKIFVPKEGTPETSRIASSIYLFNGIVPVGNGECKITVSWPDGGADEAYNAIK